MYAKSVKSNLRMTTARTSPRVPATKVVEKGGTISNSPLWHAIHRYDCEKRIDLAGKTLAFDRRAMGFCRFGMQEKQRNFKNSSRKQDS